MNLKYTMEEYHLFKVATVKSKVINMKETDSLLFML